MKVPGAPAEEMIEERDKLKKIVEEIETKQPKYKILEKEHGELKEELVKYCDDA